MKKVSEISTVNNKNSQKRPMKRWKLIVFSILGALLLAIAVLAAANLSVLRLVFSPGNIRISERDESIAVLKQLEGDGVIRNVDISNDMSSVSFFSADESIKVVGEYDGGRLRRIHGEIDAGQVNISSIDEGRRVARVMLSPYFADAEITAILLRYSPDIIAGAVNSGNIDMSFNIGDNYDVTAIGSMNDKVEFGIIVK